MAPRSQRPKRTFSLSLPSCSRTAAVEQDLGRLVETFYAARYLRLDRRCHISSHLSGQRAHFSGLGRQFTELLAPIGCLQFHNLGKVLRPGQAHRKTETGIDIVPSNVDRLTVERHGALTSIDESLQTL